MVSMLSICALKVLSDAFHPSISASTITGAHGVAKTSLRSWASERGSLGLSNMTQGSFGSLTTSLFM